MRLKVWTKTADQCCSSSLRLRFSTVLYSVMIGWFMVSLSELSSPIPSLETKQIWSELPLFGLLNSIMWTMKTFAATNLNSNNFLCTCLGLKIIERHRMINKLLAVELATKIHALSIQVLWHISNKNARRTLEIKSVPMLTRSHVFHWPHSSDIH